MSASDISLRACRACLATDCDLKALQGRTAESFVNISGIPLTSDMPQHLCIICYALLGKAVSFRRACNTAEAILQDIRHRMLLTTNNMRTITKQPPLLLVTTKPYIIDIDPSSTEVHREPVGNSGPLVNSEPVHCEPGGSETKLDNEIKLEIDDYDDYEMDPLSEYIERERQRDELKKNGLITDLNGTTDYQCNVKKNDHKKKHVKKKTEKKHRKKSREVVKETKIKKDKRSERTKGVSDIDVKETKMKKGKRTRNTCDLVLKETEIKKDKDTETKEKGNLNNLLEYLKEVSELIETAESSKAFKELVEKKKSEDEEIEKCKEISKKYNVIVKILSKEDQLKEFEERKVSDGYVKSRLRCDVCYRGFKTESAHKNHMNSHNPALGRYECDVCSMRFKERYKLVKHMAERHKYAFKCKRCEYITPSAKEVVLHHEWHSGVTYLCQHCGKSFAQYSTHVNHARLRHGRAACALCGRLFAGAFGLRVHMRRSHRQALDASCKVCGIMFFNQEALGLHTSTAPADCRTVAPCRQCGAGFPTAEQAREHAAEAHRKRFDCKHCPKTFKTERTLIHHVNKTHYQLPALVRRAPRPDQPKTNSAFVCHICGKTFNCAAKLRYHEPVHSGARPHRCALCTKGFHSRALLTMHMKIHSEERPFGCSVCPKRFYSKGNLLRHENIHSGERRFKCPVCARAFGEKRAALLHHQAVHLKLPVWRKRPRRRRDQLSDSPQHVEETAFQAGFVEKINQGDTTNAED